LFRLSELTSRTDDVENQVSLFEAKLRQSRFTDHETVTNLFREVKLLGNLFIYLFHLMLFSLYY